MKTKVDSTGSPLKAHVQALFKSECGVELRNASGIDDVIDMGFVLGGFPSNE
jgi:hypothetical protein